MKIEKFRKNGQQEMVGFVLIVVLVVVAMMVFLILSLKTSSEPEDSLEVQNLITSLMRHTTDCAISYEPEYDDFEDLFKSCYKDQQCSNLKKDACDYLEESLKDFMFNIMEGESIDYYEVIFFQKDDGEDNSIINIDEGNCSNGKISAAQKTLDYRGESLVVRIRTCSNY